MEHVFLYQVFYLATVVGSVIICLFLLYKSLHSEFEKIYFLTNFSAAVWSLGRYMLLTDITSAQAVFWAHVLYFGSVTVYVFFLHSVFAVLEIRSYKWIILTPLYSVIAVLFLLNGIDLVVGTHLFLGDIQHVLFFDHYESPGTFYWLHLVQNLLIPQLALMLLMYAYVHTYEPLKKKQLLAVIISSVFGFLGGNTAIFLVYDIHVLPAGVFLVPINFIVMTYALLRLELIKNIKTITTELFCFSLVLVQIVELVSTTTYVQFYIQLSLLALVLLLSYFLIGAVYNEVYAREEIEKLAKELEQKNSQLAELNQRKTEFVSFANHQLRAPLQAINGYTSLLLDGNYGDVSDRQRDALQKNLEAGQLMSLTIDDFLNIAKIELNKIEYQKEKRDIRELVETVAREQRLAIEKKNLTLTVKNYARPLYAMIDFNKLKQVISNLLDNSAKYTRQGGITISVDTTDRLAKITLSDTGIGIPEDQLPKLFDKFSRASNANQGDNKGTGLGLYVAKQMIEAHGGTIQASSEGAGKGSVFTIRIPLV